MNHHAVADALHIAACELLGLVETWQSGIDAESDAMGYWVSHEQVGRFVDLDLKLETLANILGIRYPDTYYPHDDRRGFTKLSIFCGGFGPRPNRVSNDSEWFSRMRSFQNAIQTYLLGFAVKESEDIVEPVAAESLDGEAVALPTNSRPDRDNGRPYADSDTFSVRWGSEKKCELGNTKLYLLYERLSRIPGRPVDIDTLRSDVWKDENGDTSDAVIQQTVSALRKKLSAEGMEAIVIDGKKYRGRYVLTLPSATGD